MSIFTKHSKFLSLYFSANTFLSIYKTFKLFLIYDEKKSKYLILQVDYPMFCYMQEGGVTIEN